MDIQGDARAEVRARRARGRPRSDKVEMIESEVLAGALREFLRHGYGGTSMTQIVRSLGISKTTLYSRYPSKSALFRAIISQQIEGLALGTVLHADAARLPLEDGLRAYGLRTLETSFEEDILQINRLIYSESHRFPELGFAAAARGEIGIGQVAGFIAECAVRDGIACRDPAGIAAAFIFMLRGWYVNMMLTNEPVSQAAMKRFADQAVRALISSRAGW